MDNPLANPRRTKLDAWPSRRQADSDADHAGRPADAESSAAEDELAAR
ncbi:hypothetical protein AGRA3207_002481 [Actinomadura graeca]|uniref:Uncharacterized protein n=1 Tax=Actinomadura graeca TaxID=2750812 RepID=A0ABX8QTB2_9ACTN|nr:hypothetical protein [Actinomadura graeca]QXJ21611.1 hypothetical protein AGRA3207_002481 [Actinomadura graeca]